MTVWDSARSLFRVDVALRSELPLTLNSSVKLFPSSEMGRFHVDDNLRLTPNSAARQECHSAIKCDTANETPHDCRDRWNDRLGCLQSNGRVPARHEFFEGIARTHSGTDVLAGYGDDQCLFSASAKHLLGHGRGKPIP